MPKPKPKTVAVPIPATQAPLTQAANLIARDAR
jgi:hypothetical protein